MVTALRPLGPADIPAHAALLAAVQAGDGTPEHRSEDDLREEYEHPAVELGADIVGAFEGEELVGFFGVLPRSTEGNPLKVHLEGAVRPDHRGRGVGTTLVAAMLARADAVHAEREPTNSARFTLGGLTSDTAQGSLLTAAGLRGERWSFTMRTPLADLDLDAPRPLPDGFRLPTYTTAYEDALREAHNEAFLDHPDFTPWTPAMWQQWVVGSRSFRPDLSLVLVHADDPGRVVAYVQNDVSEAYFAATGRREGHVARGRHPARTARPRGGRSAAARVAPALPLRRLRRGLPGGRRREPDRRARGLRAGGVRGRAPLDHVRGRARSAHTGMTRSASQCATPSG